MVKRVDEELKIEESDDMRALNMTASMIPRAPVEWHTTQACMYVYVYVPVADPGVGWGGRGDHPPPLVAENCVCSNSNFSPTGAITPAP